MAGKNDNFDALMAMMALKHIMDDMKDIEIHPFTCEVTVTPKRVSGVPMQRILFPASKRKSETVIRLVRATLQHGLLM